MRNKRLTALFGSKIIQAKDDLAAAAFILAGAIGLLGGCEINKPEMPTFDTTVSIPLGIEHLLVADLVEDEDFLVVGSDSSLGFFMDGDPDTVAFGFDLTVDIPSQSIQQGVGNFDLPALAAVGYAFELGAIWPPAAGITNQSAVVPAFPLDTASGGQDLPGIESATLAEGAVTITITNGLPVPVSANGGPQQVTVQLVDPATGLDFASCTFPAILPGSQSIQLANLAGTHLPGMIGVTLSGGSPGSSGNIVNVNGSDALDITVAFANLVVTSATAAVGPQSFQTDCDTPLPDDYQITRATIGSGSVTLSVSNDLPLPSSARITWSNLVDLNGNPLSEDLNLPPGQTLVRDIDFTGLILEAGAEPLTTLAAEVVINTAGSAGVPVTMSASDGLTVDLSSGAITFSSVTGTVPAYEIPVDPIEEVIDLPDELEGLELTAAAMIVHLTNSAALSGGLELTLTGTSAAGQVRTMEVSRTIAPAIDRSPLTTDIVLDQNNSSILDFLNNLPESIALTGSLQIGGDGSAGTISGDDFVVVSWEISAPLEVIILGSTITSDPRAIDLDQDLREMIQDHALSACIQTEILNHFPVGVELSILAGTDPATLESSPLLIIGPLVVDAALLDSITHAAITPVISRPTVTLTEQQAALFALPGLMTAVSVVLPATNGQPVRMMATDYLEIRGIVQIDVLVNDQF